jgi:hypothetical protein
MTGIIHGAIVVNFAQVGVQYLLEVNGAGVGHGVSIPCQYCDRLRSVVIP